MLIEILRSRVAHYLHPCISDEQYGFMPGRGTADSILALRNIIKKTSIRQERELWILFVDYTKAFDSVDHCKMLKAMKDLGVPDHLTWLVQKLYDKANGCIRVEDDHTEMFPFKRGVRQGCPLYPLLFIAVREVIMRKVESELSERPWNHRRWTCSLELAVC